MLIPIYIDTASILEKYSQITPDQVDAMCDNIAKSLAAKYAQRLEKEAINALHQTRRRYINSIQVVDSGKLEGTVLVDFSKDPMVRMIEEGASAFDMKEGLLNSPKAKMKNGRRYITIPFRIGTPGIVADSDVFSGSMPQEVYDVIRGKEANISVPGRGNRSEGLFKKELPVQYQSAAKRAEIKDSEGKTLFKEYQHKSSIYVGLMKFTDSVTGQNTYGSFRRISEPGTTEDGKRIGSDPDAFIHPGIEKYNLVQKALNNFQTDTEISVALNNEFSKLGL